MHIYVYTHLYYVIHSACRWLIHEAGRINDHRSRRTVVPQGPHYCLIALLPNRARRDVVTSIHVVATRHRVIHIGHRSMSYCFDFPRSSVRACSRPNVINVTRSGQVKPELLRRTQHTSHANMRQ